MCCRRKKCHCLVGSLFNAFKFFVADIEFFLLGFFGGKSLYHTLTEKTVLNLCVKLTYLNALVSEGTAHFFIEMRRNYNHKRHAQENYKRERNTVGAKYSKADGYF